MKTQNEIIMFRKKRKRRMFLIEFAIFVVIALGIALIAINAETIFEPLRGIASKINTTTTDEVGFPVKLPGSASYVFDKFNDNFLLLTDTYLYTYGSDGRQIYAMRHGYTNPVATANDKRILLYDKSSLEFSLYNKTSLLFEKQLGDKIVYASLSDNDTLAVVTSSTRYSNILYIYKGNGDLLYTRKFVDENVMQVAFTSDENSIIVTTVGALGGEIISNVYRYSIKSDAEAVWQYTFTNNAISCGIDVSKSSVKVLCDNICATFNINTGELLGSYPFQYDLIRKDLANGDTTLFVNDNNANKQLLVLLDENSNFLCSTVVPVDAVELQTDDTNIYLLSTDTCVMYDKTLAAIKEIPLQKEYSNFLMIGGKLYLLSYETVDLIELQNK